MANEFKYTTAIDKIRKMKARKKVVQGGTSAGKTWAILPILIDMAIKEDNLEVSVVSDTLPNLRRGALKDFIKIMKMTGRWMSEHWNKTHLTYTFGNGSTIEFFGVDDEMKVRGPRRHVLYINEANRLPFDIYYQLSIRTSKDIFIDYNPTLKFWAHNEVVGEDDAEFIILTYEDNEALSEEIRREILKNKEKAKTSEYWANWWKVYGEGKIGKLEGVIFHNWDMIDKIPEEATLLGLGLDFGFTNDQTAAIALYKWNGKLILDEVIFAKGLLNEDIASRLKEYRQYQIYADSAEPKSIAEIKRYGIKIAPTKKGRDSITYGIQILQEYDILVTRSSKNLIDELSKYSWVKNKDGDITNQPEDKYNHAIDATRYFAIMKLGKKESGAKMPFKIG